MSDVKAYRSAAEFAHAELASMLREDPWLECLSLDEIVERLEAIIDALKKSKVNKALSIGAEK